MAGVSIRILVAEDHPLVRAGLERLLETEDGLEIVAVAVDGEQAVELALRHRPDVVLMDLSMPVLDGIEATRRIHAAAPAIRIVVLTLSADDADILAALDAGAIGYLFKDADPDEIVRAVRAAAQGEAPLAPRAGQAVLRERERRKPAELTAREREVLSCVAQGMPNKEIARRLAISQKTVKAHLTRIYQRLGVTDRTQAALWAQRRGLG